MGNLVDCGSAALRTFCLITHYTSLHPEHRDLPILRTLPLTGKEEAGKYTGRSQAALRSGALLA
jgi:hypothetical protein